MEHKKTLSKVRFEPLDRYPTTNPSWHHDFQIGYSVALSYGHVRFFFSGLLKEDGERHVVKEWTSRYRFTKRM